MKNKIWIGLAILSDNEKEIISLSNIKKYNGTADKKKIISKIKKEFGSQKCILFEVNIAYIFDTENVYSNLPIYFFEPIFSNLSDYDSDKISELLTQELEELKKPQLSGFFLENRDVLKTYQKAMRLHLPVGASLYELENFINDLIYDFDDASDALIDDNPRNYPNLQLNYCEVNDGYYWTKYKRTN